MASVLYRRITLQEGVDGLVLEMTQLGSVVKEIRVREIHATQPTKHVEEALEAVGERLVGAGFTVNVTIRPVTP